MAIDEKQFRLYKETATECPYGHGCAVGSRRCENCPWHRIGDASGRVNFYRAHCVGSHELVRRHKEVWQWMQDKLNNNL